MNRVKLILLGEAYLDGPGGRIDLDTRKAIALLAFLAISGRPRSRDELATFFWPESDPSGARGALRRTLSALRKALPDAALDASREAIGVVTGEEFTCDAVEFRALIGRYRQHSHEADEVCPECMGILENAISLYAGDFMAGFSLRDSLDFDNWQFLEAEQFRREYALALQGFIQELIKQGRWDQAIEQAYSLLALDPLNENAHRRLMELYAQRGYREAAFRQYRECVRILDQELGVEPLKETSLLYDAIRNGEFPARELSLAPLKTEVHLSSDVRLGWSTENQADVQPGSRMRVEEQSLPFTGRTAEMEKLLRLYASLGERGYLCVVRGENGIGRRDWQKSFNMGACTRWTGIARPWVCKRN